MLRNQIIPQRKRELGHREYVGGLWNELGKLQFEFLISEGLLPHHYLLDLACGSLRAGVHFIPYLEAGHYLGIDKEDELISAGIEKELGLELNEQKKPQFVISKNFEFDKFDVFPDYALAQSLFTHLPETLIENCLIKLRQFIPKNGVFYATFVEVGVEITNPLKPNDHEFFAYTRRQMERFGTDNGWSSEYIGDWNHPRNQVMVRYRPNKKFTRDIQPQSEERHRILIEWNNTKSEYPADKCIHHLFEEHAERTPDAVAVVFENERITYRELNARANQLAHYLPSLGAGPEVPVALCFERSPDMIAGIIGILKAGGAYLPLDPHYPKERITYMMEDAGVQLVLTQHTTADCIPETGATVLCLEDVPGSHPLRCAGEECCVTPDNLAYIIYTSGSTGAPKGVMITHKMLCNLASAQISLFDISPESIVLQFASLSFDASVSEIFTTLLSGATLCLARQEDMLPGKGLLRVIREHGVTHLTLPPSALGAMSAEMLPSLKTLIVAGEACPPELAAVWAENRVFINAYGPTESTVCASAWTYRTGTNILPVGRPIANIRLYILNAHFQPQPAGVSGELYISGASLARGYLSRPDITAEKFLPNPFSGEPGARLYRTGDIARYLPDGNIEFLGRRDHQVKIRGFRIETGEIEAALSAHPTVREQIVIARKHDEGDTYLIAYVVETANVFSSESRTAYPARNRAEELREYLKQKLPEYMVPAFIIFLETMPLTPNGKIDRQALPKPEKNDMGIMSDAPRTPIEETITSIWTDILHLEQVGIHDNFFKLGGHSLLIAELMSRIQKTFNLEFPIGYFLSSPTIAELSAYIRETQQKTGILYSAVPRQERAETSWSSLVPMQPHGDLTPLFLVPGIGGNVLTFSALSQSFAPARPCYGLQAVGLDGVSEPHSSFEAMAAHYCEQIRTVQFHGPYLLAGHSLGAIVVFEMARQLHQCGESVAWLGILDRPAPFYMPKPVEDDARLLCEAADFLGRQVGISAEIAPQDIESLTGDEQLLCLHTRLQQAEVLPPSVDIRRLRGWVQVYKANRKMAYTPQPDALPVQMTLFRASEYADDDTHTRIEQIIQQRGKAGEWQTYSMHPVEMTDVPGNHFTMLTEPYIITLAEKLKTRIKRAEIGTLTDRHTDRSDQDVKIPLHTQTEMPQRPTTMTDMIERYNRFNMEENLRHALAFQPKMNDVIISTYP